MLLATDAHTINEDKTEKIFTISINLENAQNLPFHEKIAILKTKLTCVNEEESSTFIKNASKSLNYLHCLAKRFGSLRKP